MPYKYLINKTGVDLTVTMIERKGSEPGNDGPTHNFTLTKGQSERVTYGTEQNPYLNVLGITWESSGYSATQSQRVLTRGCGWDDMLNTKDTFTFNSVHTVDITSSNS
jgi:hypothetical protein